MRTHLYTATVAHLVTSYLFEYAQGNQRPVAAKNLFILACLYDMGNLLVASKILYSEIIFFV